jgi:hypothetical protein
MGLSISARADVWPLTWDYVRDTPGVYECDDRTFKASARLLTTRANKNGVRVTLYVSPASGDLEPAIDYGVCRFRKATESITIVAGNSP